ncbi:MAG TPA: PhzF family phenazine biosynthesis protein, partial [Bacilli bacterium]|nr:PhzF family phenazine biosynthesis protein [Bacilli bacterium]
MAVAIYQVDAFTKEAFSGNSAAVCLIKTAVTDEWMQKVAMEMNVSETAFVMKEKDGFRLRWFTPEKEVSLCALANVA